MEHKRQGDLLFIKLNKAIKKEAHSPILALGEVTGHSHVVAKADLSNCDVFIDTNGLLCIHVKHNTIKIVHEEHAPIVLPIGTWEVRRQREYLPQGSQQVKD